MYQEQRLWKWNYAEELKEFREGLLKIVKNVEFKNADNDFLNNLNEICNSIDEEKKIILPADKTTNFYKITETKYNELINKNIQKEYKKADDNIVKELYNKEKELAEKLELGDRMFATSKKDAFITGKDHKSNFKNNPQCRLINPSKLSWELLARKF